MKERDWRSRGWQKSRHFADVVYIDIPSPEPELSLETSKWEEPIPHLRINPVPGNIASVRMPEVEMLIGALHNWRSMVLGHSHHAEPLTPRLQVVQDFLSERGVTVDEIALLWLKARAQR